MKNVYDMNADDLEYWMDKTIESAKSAAERGRQASGIPKISKRFETLKSFFKECGVWPSYCESRGIEVDCDVEDFFAEV